MSTESNVQYATNGLLMSHLNASGPLGGPNMLQGTFVNLAQNSSPAVTPGAMGAQPTLFKITNLPLDLTQREALLIFTLVSDDIINVDLKDFTIAVHFKNAATCLATGRYLDGKCIFGPAFAPVKVEFVDFDPSMGLAHAFDSSMRLSNQGISPPSSHQILHPTLHPVAPLSLLNASQLLSQAAVPPPGFESFQKRKSVGNQRSRFLFSDPFSGNATPANTAAQNVPGSIDFSDLSGKSLLLMESQNDAREYESLVRDPWAQPQMGFGSNPQTPGLTAPVEWSTQKNPERRRTSAFFNGVQDDESQQQNQQNKQQQQQQQQAQQQQAQQQQAQQQQAQQQQNLSQQQNQQQSQQQSQPQQNQPQTNQPQTNQQHQRQPQTVAAILSQGPTQSNGSLPPLAIPPTPSRNGASSAGSGSQPTSATTPTSGARSSTKDVPDLSLLARVPPPANPADQNPPCNTLYVGNLPPDATEAELRALFSPQKGFRRLSFRTKNQSSSLGLGLSGHNHGPMCFVEFEDVAHATIALAELYGRALPRPNGSNGKGGIRLSFSKNPLGVRGPGNPRRSSTNQQPSSGSTSANGSSYGYQNFH